jgi:hypothetical protein
VRNNFHDASSKNYYPPKSDNNKREQRKRELTEKWENIQINPLPIPGKMNEHICSNIQSCWRFRSSGMWRCVVGQVAAYASTEHCVPSSWRFIPEDLNPQLQHCQNLKSYRHLLADCFNRRVIINLIHDFYGCEREVNVVSQLLQYPNFCHLSKSKYVFLGAENPSL